MRCISVLNLQTLISPHLISRQRAKQKELKIQQRDLSTVQMSGSAPPKQLHKAVCHHCGHPIDLKRVFSRADAHSWNEGSESEHISEEDSDNVSKELDRE